MRISAKLAVAVLAIGIGLSTGFAAAAPGGEERPVERPPAGRRIRPTATWEKVRLPETQVNVLRAAATTFRETPEKKRKGLTTLLCGGTAAERAVAAEALAKDLGRDLYQIDLKAMVSKYVGETEKNLRRVFSAAEELDVILLLDEGDALFGRRSDVKDSDDRYANQETTYLLQRMEEYPGLAILSTNDEAPARARAFRKIRYVVRFPHPPRPK